jgi:hypothetical protein
MRRVPLPRRLLDRHNIAHAIAATGKSRRPARGPGPYTVEVELRYQTISYRWAENLSTYDAPEPRRFLSYFRSMSEASSVVVASAAKAKEVLPRRSDARC